MGIESLLPDLPVDGYDAMRIEPRDPSKGGAALNAAIKELVRELDGEVEASRREG